MELQSIEFHRRNPELPSLGFFRNTRRTLDKAWLRPRFDGWLDVQDAVGTLVNRALRGEINDDSCLRLSDDAVARARDVEGRR